MGDTEVAGQSPADDEQQPPEAAVSEEPELQDAPSAPGPDGAELPAADPDTKYQGAAPDTKYQG
jgi:hypothetical protein